MTVQAYGLNRWLRYRWAADPVAAGAAALVLCPVIGAIAAMVWIFDGRPVLVTLPRVGQDGRIIRLVKFRTMRPVQADGSASGPALSFKNDPRVTTLGRFLRQHRLDELPQLWNVLTGDMALIGPRPEVSLFVDRDDPRWTEVLQAKPGLACPTQVLTADWEASVLGAEPEDIYREVFLPIKLQLDAWYLKSASLFIDVLTVLSILQLMVLKRRSTLLHRRLPPDLEGLVPFPHV